MFHMHMVRDDDGMFRPVIIDAVYDRVATGYDRRPTEDACRIVANYTRSLRVHFELVDDGDGYAAVIYCGGYRGFRTERFADRCTASMTATSLCTELRHLDSASVRAAA
jgi:hypothetical protein